LSPSLSRDKDIAPDAEFRHHFVDGFAKGKQPKGLGFELGGIAWPGFVGLNLASWLLVQECSAPHRGPGGFPGFRPFELNGPRATRGELLARMHDHIRTVVGR